MARQLTDEQVEAITAAVRSVADIAEPRDLHQVVAALAANGQTGFSAGELQVFSKAVAALERPLAEGPPWPSQKGRGCFFVFEGLDRSGKSTQSRLLREHLQRELGEQSVRWMCFPARDTAIGCLIDLYLRNKIELGDRAIHLLFAANRWEMAEGIVGDLVKGVTVVCDRYVFSGVAYTAAKGLDFDWCQAPDRGLPAPDAVFFMRVDPEVGAARANFGDERYENAEFQAKVRAEFQLSRLHSGVDWHTVDGSRSIEEIHEEIRASAAALAKLAQEGEGRPVASLWMQAN